MKRVFVTKMKQTSFICHYKGSEIDAGVSLVTRVVKSVSLFTKVVQLLQVFHRSLRW